MHGIPERFNEKPLLHAWTYRAADGAPLGIVGRYQGANGKEVVPFFRMNGHGFTAGAAPDPRPLFGLEYLAKDADRRAVVIVEGEKCAAGLQSLGLCAVTSQGGSKAASKTDWGTLSGYGKAYLLPDNDEPGEAYMRDVCAALQALEAPPALSVVRLPELPPAGDVVDWLQSLCPDWNGVDPIPDSERERLYRAFREVIKAHAEPVPAEWIMPEEPAADDWQAPIPLEAAALPVWPDDVFPDVFQDYVSGLAEATETPPELPALMVLAVMGAAAQGKYQVNVKPGYFEPVNVWTCPALVPGSRKTAVKNAATAPLTDWERKQRTAMEAEIKQAESDHKTITERIATLRKVAAKAKGPEFDQMKADIADMEANLPEIPKPPKAWADDITPENLGTVMADNGERMAILSDEAGLFEMMGGRYSGGIPNIDIYLQGHAGTAVKVDRGSRPPVFMRNATLTIGISPQPDVLRGLTEKPSFRARGLLARFLYALPASNLGRRTGNTRPLSEDLRLRYAGRIEAILNAQPATDQDGEPCPHTLKLSRGAFEAWQAFWCRVEAGLGPGGMYEHCFDWGGKLPGAVVRIAGLFHIARHIFRGPESIEISGEDMSAALRMAEALSAHALAVFDLMGADPALDGARVALGWLRRERLETFTFRDCHYAHKSRFRRADELGPVLDVLTERHYIRPLAMQGKPQGGRPSKAYEVNPSVTMGA
ncbi:YfjI family protein [Methylococcus sp. EFPC2]|uniref:YfjI family protein n=1 Tax=Methylococcus sp. EFPC2 TaxID=2812648 RepID=UPI001967CE8A|nr:YfjI family protein [Methylococcus sp. EFPC2]QSA97731.1 DUF3987 domain-containing protein [Methylococcus sp. EFPC2]